MTQVASVVKAFVDTRERELIPLLSPWPARTLHVGDIWIGLSGEHIATGGIVAERKTTDDLEASILDGRYREQRTRLTTYCQQHGARPLYIIEGMMDRLWGKLTAETMQKYLNRLALRYGVAVIHTEGTAATAALCKMLAAQIAADASVFVSADPAALTYSSTVSVSKRENRDNPRNFAAAALQGCPGVSSAAAEAVLDACGGTLAGVWAAEETSLAVIIVGKRKLGPAVAKRLWNCLHGGGGA
jgi:ERCC4-type nuclease